MILLFIYVFIALFFSFFCSLMEAVILTIPISFVAAKENEHKKKGARLRELKTNIDRPLAAILSLNTIAHTLGAAGAGAQAAAVFGNQYVGVASAILTLLILIFSEIIPKSLGAQHWRKLSGPVAFSLSILIPLMIPFVWISKYITMLFSKEGPHKSFTREEFKAMAEMGEKSGMLKKQETRILRSLFRFNSLKVEDIMTPRTVVFALSETLNSEQVIKESPEIIFSRIPVYSENLDHVTGYVLKSDILQCSAIGETPVQLSELKRDIYRVPASMTLPDIYDFLLNQREHLSLVLDEYGGTAGIVSIEDIVETILGKEIMDEVDTTEDMQDLARFRGKERSKGMVKAGTDSENSDD